MVWTEAEHAARDLCDAASELRDQAVGHVPANACAKVTDAILTVRKLLQVTADASAHGTGSVRKVIVGDVVHYYPAVPGLPLAAIVVAEYLDGTRSLAVFTGRATRRGRASTELIAGVPESAQPKAGHWTQRHPTPEETR